MSRHNHNLFTILMALAFLVSAATIAAAQPVDRDRGAELLPEGEYFLVARTTDNHWATGTAELTHDIPAGPEIVEPIPPDNEDECSTGVFVDIAVIEWDPVDTDIWGDEGIEIEGYQVIVEAEEGPDRKFSVTVPADTTMVSIPEEVLVEGTEFKFEVLAIEESGNQTITEGCFETEG